MILNVKVVEANELPAMDLFGKIDPFVVLTTSGSKQIQKTKVIEKCYSPVWNETFKFIVSDVSTDSLTLIIRDKDSGSSDDPVSRLVIQLSDIRFGDVTDKWYDLVPAPKLKKGGRIRLAIHLCNSNDQPFVKSASAPQQAQVQPQAQPQVQPQVQPQQMTQQMPQQPGMYQQVQPGMYPQQMPMQPGMYPQQMPMQPGMYPQQMPMQPGMYPQQMPMQPGMYPQQMPMQPGMYPQQMHPGMYPRM